MNSELQKSAPVDLEQFREAVECWRDACLPANSVDAERVAAADRLLSIIDNAGKVDVSPQDVRKFIANRVAGPEHKQDILDGDYDGTEWFGHVRAALAQQPAPVVGDALVEYVRREIECAASELDSVTAIDDASSDGIGCAENALERALYALAHGVQS